MKKEFIKIDEARFILQNDYDIGKRKMKCDFPIDLKQLNKGNKYRTIIGIGRGRNKEKDIYVCLSRGNEILYVGKSVWLKIAESLKKIKKGRLNNN